MEVGGVELASLEWQNQSVVCIWLSLSFMYIYMYIQTLYNHMLYSKMKTTKKNTQQTLNYVNWPSVRVPLSQSIGHSFTHSLTYWDIHDLTHLCLCYRNHEKTQRKHDKPWPSLQNHVKLQKTTKTWFMELMPLGLNKFCESCFFCFFLPFNGLGGLVIFFHAFFVFFHGL